MQSGMIRYTGEVNCGKAIHFCKRIYNSDKHKQLYLCAAVMPYGRNPISFNRIFSFFSKELHRVEVWKCQKLGLSWEAYLTLKL